MKKKLVALITSLLLITTCFIGVACKGNTPGNNSDSEISSGSDSVVVTPGGDDEEVSIYMPATLEIAQYDSTEIQVEILGATIADIEWDISDKTVIMFKDGVISGLKEGTSTITATVGKASASCIVTVTKSYAYPILVLSQEEAMPRVGGSVEVTANIRLNGKITGFDEFTWISADESIATVENGKITGVKAGTTTVTARAIYNDILLEEIVLVTVVNAPTA